jgi:hypothetical protein
LAIKHISQIKAREMVKDIRDWPERNFCHRTLRGIAGISRGGSSIYWNYSNPEIIAQAARRFVAKVGAKELMGRVVEPLEVTAEIIKENRGDIIIGRGVNELWLSCPLRKISPKDRMRLKRFFEQTKVTKQFHGGLLSQGEDCAVMAELLSIYAFYNWIDDVYLVWTDRPLAIVACHQADLHLRSPNEAILNESAEIMKSLGLQEVPGPMQRIWLWTPNEELPCGLGALLTGRRHGEK